MEAVAWLRSDASLGFAIVTDDVLFWVTIDSPVGPLLLTGTPDSLVSISFLRHSNAAPPPQGLRNDRALRKPLQQLDEYFRGERRRFDLEVDPRGTAFQRSVWNALMKIPYGETRSYGELARAIGKPAASRAVGAANGANPIPIVIPCHRVIGSGGSLTGFGGGLDAKRYLLDLESGKRALAFH